MVLIPIGTQLCGLKIQRKQMEVVQSMEYEAIRKSNARFQCTNGQS